MNIECGFDCIDGKHVPTVKIMLDACGPDDNEAWEERDLLAKKVRQIAHIHDANADLLAALQAITNSGPDAIPIKEAFEMAHRAIERALTPQS
jgi:hypothetical protein